LSTKHLTVDLRNLDTLELGNISTLLLGETATLSVGGFRALSSWNSLALFLLHSLTLPLLDVVALLLGHILALLGGHISALLLVVNLLTNLLGNWVAFLSIDSLALTAWNIPAFLLWHLRALPITNNTTLLGRHVLTDLILNGLALLLVDNLTLSFSSGSTFLLIDRTALVFKRGATLLIILRPTFLFMNSFGDSPWHTDTLQLRNTVTLLILDGATLLPGVLSSLAILLVFKTTLLSGDRLLDRSLRNLALSLLNISTNGVRNVAAFFLGNRFVRSLGNLVANLFWNLSTHRFRGSHSLNRWRIKLRRQITEG